MTAVVDFGSMGSMSAESRDNEELSPEERERLREAERRFAGLHERLSALRSLVKKSERAISAAAGMNPSHLGVTRSRKGNLGGDEIARLSWTSGISANYLLLGCEPIRLEQAAKSEREVARDFAIGGRLRHEAIDLVMRRAIPADDPHDRFYWLNQMQQAHQLAGLESSEFETERPPAKSTKLGTKKSG